MLKILGILTPECPNDNFTHVQKEVRFMLPREIFSLLDIYYNLTYFIIESLTVNAWTFRHLKWDYHFHLCNLQMNSVEIKHKGRMWRFKHNLFVSRKWVESCLWQLFRNTCILHQSVAVLKDKETTSTF